MESFFIEILPVELWELILSNISYSEDIYHVSLVSKLFNTLIKQSITCINSKNIINTVILQKYPKVKKITGIVKIKTKKELYFISSRKFTQISLNIITDLDLDIKEFIFNNRQLENVYIERTGNRYFSYELCNGYVHCSNIEYVDYDNEHIKQIHLNHDSDYPIKFNKNLKYVVYDFNLHYGMDNFLVGPWNINVLVGYGDVMIDHTVNRYPNYYYNFYITCDYPIDKFKTVASYIVYKYPNSNFDNIVYDRTAFRNLEYKKMIETKNLLDQHSNKWEKSYDMQIYYGYIKLYQQYKNTIKEIDDNPMTEIEVYKVFFYAGEHIHINKTFKVI